MSAATKRWLWASSLLRFRTFYFMAYASRPGDRNIRKPQADVYNNVGRQCNFPRAAPVLVAANSATQDGDPLCLRVQRSEPAATGRQREVGSCAVLVWA